MVDIDYNTYANFVEYIVSIKDISYFKSHPNYTYMLEHVNEKQGYEYLSCITNKTNISINDILDFCELNDKQGSPNKINFGFITASPTSLRYIWQAHVILSYFKSFHKDSYDIVEVGGGYGGLCFAINYFAKQYNVTINSYTIVDLKGPSNLQKMYLENLPLQTSLNFVDAVNFGADINKNDLFLISNYCFSEINNTYQKQYINHLFPKVIHGFIAWNMIPVYDFGYPTRVEEEVPNTGHLNKFVYF